MSQFIFPPKYLLVSLLIGLNLFLAPVTYALTPSQKADTTINDQKWEAAKVEPAGTSAKQRPKTAATPSTTESTRAANRTTSTDSDATEKRKDGTFIARDEISFYGGIVHTLAWFITGAAVLFGAIVGINVFQGSSILSDAREELKGLRDELHKVKEAKDKYDDGLRSLSGTVDKIFAETVSKIQAEAVRSIEEFVRKEFGLTTVARYKAELLNELEKDAPDEKFVFVRLTDIIKYPDAVTFQIYASCMAKLSKSRDIVHIVTRGLQMAAETNQQNTPQVSPA